MTNLLHKTAFITGATSGIGKSIAILLAKKKCNLVCVGRDKERLGNLKKEITEDISFFSYECDIAFENDIKDLIQKISADSIMIDILIHSAGILKTNSIVDSTITEYNSHFNVNVKAPFLITKLLLPVLKKNNGQIVFINSSAIQRAIPNLSLYSATKFALKGFADCLRQEVNQFGIRVLSVYPGQTATPMQKELYENGNKLYNPENLLQTTDIASLVVNTLELPKTAEVTDLFVRPFLKG